MGVLKSCTNSEDGCTNSKESGTKDSCTSTIPFSPPTRVTATGQNGGDPTPFDGGPDTGLYTPSDPSLKDPYPLSSAFRPRPTRSLSTPLSERRGREAMSRGRSSGAELSSFHLVVLSFVPLTPILSHIPRRMSRKFMVAGKKSCRQTSLTYGWTCGSPCFPLSTAILAYFPANVKEVFHGAIFSRRHDLLDFRSGIWYNMDVQGKQGKESIPCT